MTKTLEEQLHPNSNKLTFPDKEWKALGEATLVDCELDPIHVEVDGYSASVTLNTEDLAYVMLDVEQLYLLIDWIEQCENYANEPGEKLTDS